MSFKESYNEVLLNFYIDKIKNFCKRLNTEITDIREIYDLNGISFEFIEHLTKAAKDFKVEEDTFYSYRTYHIDEILRHTDKGSNVHVVPKYINKHMTALVHRNTFLLIREISNEIAKSKEEISQTKFFEYLNKILESVKLQNEDIMSVEDIIYNAVYIGETVNILLQNKDNLYFVDNGADFEKFSFEDYQRYIEKILRIWTILVCKFKKKNPKNIKCIILNPYFFDINNCFPYFNNKNGLNSNGVITKHSFYEEFFNIDYFDVEEIESKYERALKGVFYDIFLCYLLNLQKGVSEIELNKILDKYFKEE